MDHHQIFRIQASGHHQPAPLQVVCAPADPSSVGLALDTVQLVLAFESHPFGAAQKQPIGSAIGAARQLLDDMAVQMLAQPGVSKLLGKRLQREVREGMLRSCRSKEARALGIVPGKRPRLLEGFGLAHEPHPLAGLAQAGVVDRSCRFQASEQRVLLVRMHPQRDFADKARMRS